MAKQRKRPYPERVEQVHSQLVKAGKLFWKEFSGAVAITVAPWWTELALQYFPDKVPSDAIITISFRWAAESHNKLWIRIGVDRDTEIIGPNGLRRRSLGWSRILGKHLRVLWHSFFGDYLYIQNGVCGVIRVNRPSKHLLAKAQTFWKKLDDAEAKWRSDVQKMRSTRRSCRIRGEQYLKSIWYTLEQKADKTLLSAQMNVTGTSCHIQLHWDLPTAVGRRVYFNYTRHGNRWKTDQKPPPFSSWDLNQLYKFLDIANSEATWSLGDFETSTPSAHEIAVAKLAVGKKLKK